MTSYRGCSLFLSGAKYLTVPESNILVDDPNGFTKKNTERKTNCQKERHFQEWAQMKDIINGFRDSVNFEALFPSEIAFAKCPHEMHLIMNPWRC